MIKSVCPICGQKMEGQGPDEWPEFPFCSKRCKTIDLGRWLGGNTYGVPSTRGDQEPGDEADEREFP